MKEPKNMLLVLMRQLRRERRKFKIFAYHYIITAQAMKQYSIMKTNTIPYKITNVLLGDLYESDSIVCVSFESFDISFLNVRHNVQGWRQ